MPHESDKMLKHLFSGFLTVFATISCQVVELLLACDLSNRLRSECSADVLENDRTTCLHLAARNGHVDVLK